MSDLKREHPNFDDPQDLVNAVISTLQQPDEKTFVAIQYANDKNLASEVQAYAKIAGCDWTFYVKLLAILIGRNTETPLQFSNTHADIDLGPAKVVSRQHAAIIYNIDLRCWEFKVMGRNGARVDGTKVAVGTETATPLHSGAILDIGGTQMMFILPDAPPSILQKILDQCLSRYKPEKKMRVGMGQFLGVTNFQMYDKAHMAQAPLHVSAVSLQNNLDQDLSREEAKDIKPPYLYATMITQAILLNPDGVLSLAEIYAWILSHYAYYKYLKTGWQNLIRHNLSLNKAFEKVPRRPNEPGKGMKWQISDDYKAEFMKKMQNGTLLKSRRGSSVSRTLQIHLATHAQLPESQAVYKPESVSDTMQRQPMPYVPLNQYQQPPPPPPQQQHFQPNGYGYGNAYPMPVMHERKEHLPFQSECPPVGVMETKPPQIGTPSFNPPQPNGYSSGMKTTHTSGPPDSSGADTSSMNTSQFRSASVSQQNSTAPSTTNNTELGLGFSSPKKITPLEAFTPERGSKAPKTAGQSSPAFWNFVQFSTPNGQTPHKNGESNDAQLSPTVARLNKVQPNGSPSNMATGIVSETPPGKSN